MKLCKASRNCEIGYWVCVANLCLNVYGPRELLGAVMYIWSRTRQDLVFPELHFENCFWSGTPFLHPPLDVVCGLDFDLGTCEA